MKKFWFLMTAAFVDLAVAGILAGWGQPHLALPFFALALLLGAYALFSPPPVRRDPRGRLQGVELPYGAILGIVGAITILACGAYVALSSSATISRDVSAMHESRGGANRLAAPIAPPTADRRSAPESFAVLRKCVDGNGHVSYQSARCQSGSNQVWIRDATPEPPPTRAQLARLAAQQRRAAAEASAGDRRYASAAGNGGAWMAENSQSQQCAMARNADAAYRRRPLSQITYDGLRLHGDRILEACH